MNLSNFKTVTNFNFADTLPDQCCEGCWVGRIWLPENLAENDLSGPRVVKVVDGWVYDLSDDFLTMADVFACDEPADSVNKSLGRKIISLNKLLENSLFTQWQDEPSSLQKPVLLSPNDIQATKACGVTFACSLLERIIEERAQGDAEAATEIRETILDIIGGALSDIVPGSEQAMQLKERLIEMGYWSQYLEVGIGKDAEVFTKAQPLSSVTSGYQIGVLRSSQWNNPEPEIVLAVNPAGKIIGATLGNDVNLRDYEGRSALLLGKAKDQNASCSIGPLIRLFDESFNVDDITNCAVTLSIHGEDGFSTFGENLMTEISRHPQDLVDQTVSRNHQYPDGLVLFVGTMFAPTEDRAEQGSGFTHQLGDRVEISTPKLGKLVNWVNYCDEIPTWNYGIHQLISFLRKFK